MRKIKHSAQFYLCVFAFVFLLQMMDFYIHSTFAQNQSIPQNPNLTENGKRQGKWTILLNEKKGKVDSLQYATYYRLITYQDGKPVGITQDYYLSGKLQMQGKLVSEGLAPKYEGIVTYYHPNGKKDYEEKYENGKSVSKIYFNRNGSVVKEDWEKLHDEAMKIHFPKEDYIQALALIKRGNSAAQKQFGENHAIYATCLLNEGNVYVRQKKYKQAERTLQKALKIKLNLLGREHEDYVASLVSIGTLYYNQGLLPKAASFFSEALAIGRAKHQASNPLAYAVPLNSVAIIALNAGEYKKADSLFTEASQIFEKVSKTAYAIALNNLATVYYYQTNYPKADSTARLSLKIQEEEKSQESAHYAYTLSNLYAILIKQGRYTQADSTLLLAEKIFEKAGTSNPSFATNLIGRYVIRNQYRKADSIYTVISEIQAKNVGKMHPDYATVLNNWGCAYISQSKFKQAEEKLLEAQSIFEKTSNQAHSTYFTVLKNLAELYYLQSKYKQAEFYFFKTKDLLEKNNKTNTDDYSALINSLAFYYGYQGKLGEERKFRLQCMEIAKKTIGEKHPDYAAYLKGLAAMYENQGDYSKTDSIYQVAAQIIKNTYRSENNLNYAYLLTDWGLHYYLQNNFTQSEKLYQQALKIYQDTKNESEYNYSNLLHNLASLYGVQGEYEKEEALLKELLDKAARLFGKENDTYAQALNNLASRYLGKGAYTQAEKLFQEAVQIYEQFVGRETPVHIGLLENLAGAYQIQEKYAQAEEIFKQTIAFRKAIYGEKHLDYALSLHLLANLYQIQKQYKNSIAYYEQALAIFKETKGENHPRYIDTSNQLAISYDNLQIYHKASPLFLKVAENKLTEIQNNLANLSEKGKQKYLAKNQVYLSNLPTFIAHLLEKEPTFKDLPLLCQTALNLQLRTKGWLLSESQKVRNRILASNDSTLMKQMWLWQAKRNFIAKVYQMSTAERKKRKLDLKKLEAEADDLEKQLAAHSADFSSAFNPPTYTFHDIQKKLKENEAAIDIIKGYRINWEKTESDTTFYYLALVLTKKELIPVLMTNGREMDSLHFVAHKRSVGARTSEAGYEVYWEKIAQVLSPYQINKVFFCPDGIYHQISLYTLKNPKTQQFLIDEYDIHTLTNLKEILETQAQALSTEKTAVLIGRPKYQLSKSQHEQVLASLGSWRGKESEQTEVKSAVETQWVELIGTENEVRFIDSLLRQHQWKSVAFLGEQAVEERVKQVQSPTILHLATHGYFHQSQDKNTASGMLNSGIILAGVNMQEKGENREDGVLTALEASNLRLDQTELVVLSACQTGLGEIATGEGVYGLQRGFKVAGAKSLIMSLWRVDDTVTQELMKTFYEQWLSGKNKREAFKIAQLQIKNKYKYPYFWGAFVMVGE